MNLLTKLSAICLLLVSVKAYAIPISGSATGTLSAVTGNPIAVTQVQPYQLSWSGPGNQISNLTAGVAGVDTISQDYAALGGTGVKLASLTWANHDNERNKDLNLNWNVSINLTDPAFTGSFATNTLGVNLRNGTSLDTILLDSLSGIAWNLGAWEVDNFRYVGSGLGLDGISWQTAKDNTTTLWIAADITRTVLPDNPPAPAAAPVPEPGTITLLGAGLLSLAVYCKRRKRA